MKATTFLHLGWDDVQALSEALAGKVRATGYRPSFVVAVSRGGYVPARILCDQLGVRRLGSLQIESYVGIGEPREPSVTAPLCARIEGLDALLVDDVSDSGHSLRAAVAHAAVLSPAALRVATLHVKPSTSLLPDYWAAETSAWIVYPWEAEEAASEVAESIRASEPGADVRARLLEYGFSRPVAGRHGG